MIESNRVEYKRELTDGLEKEVVAFLNAREGGLLYIGLDERILGVNALLYSLSNDLKVKSFQFLHD